MKDEEGTPTIVVGDFGNNLFLVMAEARRALRLSGRDREAAQLVSKVMGAKSYDEAWGYIKSFVNITRTGESS